MSSRKASPDVKQSQSGMVKRFRLSPQQKRLWLLHRGGLNYRAQCALLIEGELNICALKKALEEIVRRHEILRTTFHQSPEMSIPVQVVAEQCTLSWRTVDLSDLDSLKQESQVKEFLGQNGVGSFNLDRGPLMHLSLLALSATKHILLVALPSLCADARTLENLVYEIAHAYAACLQGEAILDEPLQYAQFSEWQHEILKGDDGGEGGQYWNHEGVSSAATLVLPLEMRPSGDSEFDPRLLTSVLDAGIVSKVGATAKSHHTSAAILLLACWQTLLWRLTRQPEVSISMLCDCRLYKEMETALGLYARWPPVSVHFEKSFRFAEVLARVNDAVARTYRWQEYFSPAQDASLSGNSVTSPSLFPIGFEMVRRPRTLNTAGLKISVCKQYQCTDRLKLKFSCIEAEGALTIDFHYDPVLYADGDIQRLKDQFLTLLQEVVVDARVLISNAAILGRAEQRHLLIELNDTAAAYPHGKCVHELFEVQAERTPEAPALLFGEECITYRELNHRANQLARYLRRLGVGRASRVGLFLERSVEMIVGLLGILKVGGAYVPLDPRQPTLRINFILEDVQAVALLTQRRLISRLGKSPAQVICLDAEWAEIAGESAANLKIEASADNLAYIIYTSGSTGRPKGVMVSHASVANLTTGLRESVYRNLACPLRIGLNAPLAFDSSVKQWAQLLNGHCLHILPEDVRFDIDALLSWLRQYQPDVMDCTPAQLKLMLAARSAETPGPTPVMTLVGGEALDQTIWRDLAEDTRTSYYNVYGPTECTVDSTLTPVRREFPVPTIGRPIANVRTYVLDASLNPTPIGVSGELYIGGFGLARGYNDRPDLTAERFIPDPFISGQGARLYKSGDLVRYLSDGNIEFLGRLDDQVKIRGNRIELGEIEAILSGHLSVAGCVVLARENDQGEKSLIAYVVPKILKPKSPGQGGDSAELTNHEEKPGANECSIRTAPAEAELRNFLLDQLPEYMIPASFVALESLPLTRNGKVDRQALLALEQIQSDLAETCEKSISTIEEMLAGIWIEILGVRRVDVDDDFFELGGHSLLATQLMSQVRQAFHVELPLRALFEAPTVSGLAKRVERAMQDGVQQEAPPLKPVPRDRELPLSYTQQGLWFLNQLEPGSVAYNIPLGLRLRGELNRRALRQSLSEMVRRHEALRTSFPSAEHGPIQKIAPYLEMDVEEVDLTRLAETERVAQAEREIQTEANKGFDLERGPLFRVKLLQLSDQEHILLITTHHIICDGWSIGVMTREFSRLYQAYVNDAEARPVLPELKIQYADYATWQQEWLRGDVLDNHLEYWGNHLDDMREAKVTSESSSADRSNGNAGFLMFELDRELTGNLKKIWPREGITLYMTLLAAFQLVIAEYTGREDVVIGTDIANRTHHDVEGLIGCFVNQLALRINSGGEITFKDLLKHVRRVTLEAHQYQHAPFAKVVERLSASRNSKQSTLFEVKFVLQNAPAENIVLQGLQVEPVDVKRKDAKFDFLLTVSSRAEELIGVIEYNKNIYSQSTVRMIQNQYKQALIEVAKLPDVSVAILKRDLNALRMSYQNMLKSQLKQASALELLSARRRHVG
jgi:amino acid adenylation domain-containing protein